MKKRKAQAEVVPDEGDEGDETQPSIEETVSSHVSEKDESTSTTEAEGLTEGRKDSNEEQLSEDFKGTSNSGDEESSEVRPPESKILEENNSDPPNDENQTSSEGKEEEAEKEEEEEKLNSEQTDILENPLFEPESLPTPAPIESLGNEEDLDFEPEVDEDLVRELSKDAADDDVCEVEADSEGKEKADWMVNIASPGRVPDDDTIVIDEVVISDTEDLDELGDKIDAVCRSKEAEDDSDEEGKRGWRSEKNKSSSGLSGSSTRRSPGRARPRRRITPPRRSPPRRRRSRSSSIEILTPEERPRYRSRSPRGPGRQRPLLTRARSPGELRELRAAREEVGRVRRQVAELRGRLSTARSPPRHGGRGYSPSRPRSPPPHRAPPPQLGHKLIVRNFPASMSQSEFYSMFVRKGELVSCEMKGKVGLVVFKQRAAADQAKATLNGTKNGSLVLSVRDAPPEPRPRQAPPPLESWSRPQAPPPPLLGRLGTPPRHRSLDRYEEELERRREEETMRRREEEMERRKEEELERRAGYDDYSGDLRDRMGGEMFRSREEREMEMDDRRWNMDQGMEVNFKTMEQVMGKEMGGMESRMRGGGVVEQNLGMGGNLRNANSFMGSDMSGMGDMPAMGRMPGIRSTGSSMGMGTMGMNFQSQNMPSRQGMSAGNMMVNMSGNMMGNTAGNTVMENVMGRMGRGYSGMSRNIMNNRNPNSFMDMDDVDSKFARNQMEDSMDNSDSRMYNRPMMAGGTMMGSNMMGDPSWKARTGKHVDYDEYDETATAGEARFAQQARGGFQSEGNSVRGISFGSQRGGGGRINFGSGGMHSGPTRGSHGTWSSK